MVLVRILHLLLAVPVVGGFALFAGYWFLTGALRWASGSWPWWQTLLLSAAWIVGAFLLSFATAPLACKDEKVSWVLAGIWAVLFGFTLLLPWCIGPYSVSAVLARLAWLYVASQSLVWTLIMVVMVGSSHH